MKISGSWPFIIRKARSRLAHNKTRRHVSQYGEGIEIMGVAGELVVRRFLGLDEEIHERFDHGVDIDYYGMKIDVKATVMTPNANYRFLQWPNWKRVRAEYIVMTLIDMIHQEGTIVGYATREEMMAAPINPYRNTPCHEIPFTELHPIWELQVEACRRQTSQELDRFPALERSQPRFGVKNRDGLLIPRQSRKPAGGMGSASRG